MGVWVFDLRDERRRAAFVAPLRPGSDSGTLVKVARIPGNEARAAHEQQVLSRVPVTSRCRVPAPLGHGRAGGVEWSAETVLEGRPFASVFGGQREHVLADLADWLAELACATAHPVDWRALSTAAPDSPVALRGPAEELRPLMDQLSGVPGVLVHGDLGSGHNLGVDAAGRPLVFDWETARLAGLPLADLVPLLGSGLTADRGHRGPAARADGILALAAGTGDHGRWFLQQVRSHAERLGLDRSVVGPLALLAWGHAGSMRVVRDERLRSAGLPAPAWTSLGELVLERWQRDIGPEWSAL